ncbi:type II toxin-antitoxin system Phd/YefM family antitoxin [Gloeocapsa sp. PCC 73106]|uniref:type II toxin-antitoxin system Phd/YefM family antitoxin n=1 Tax=Gloeocapsa sp. PCC 73106 TaxID=102232 RepID=UPI0002AC8C13|nr:type II toxin-antitoxin system prevent-host-death family antitoxin [Gloeocapsa sp. PCC 73106]ELR98839.1 prevent-host-death family protein [Gloeocapsa sp. PCC 73106]
MKTLNITEAKARFAELVELVLSGEEIIITKMNKPVAKLSIYEPAKLHHRLNYFDRQIKLADNFDTWPEEEAKALGIFD